VAAEIENFLLLAFLGELCYTASDSEKSSEQQDRKTELFFLLQGVSRNGKQADRFCRSVS
jgi:hypothetical protein